MNALPLRAPLLAGLVLAALPGYAQHAGPPADASAIGAGAGHDLAGRAAVNLAAGAGNLQANLAAIALSPDGTGRINLAASQDARGRASERDASARIDGGAFTGASGLLSVNQAAGSGNTQLNLFALGNTGIALDDAALAAVAGDPALSTIAPAPSTGLRDAAIADGAFRGGQGVLQLNQTAGAGNASANAIVLRLPGGTP